MPLLCYAPQNAAVLNQLMHHPLVHKLARVPAGHVPLSTHIAFTQHMQCRWPDVNASSMLLILVANAAGLASMTHVDRDQARAVLDRHELGGCQMVRPEARVGPLPRSFVMQGFKTALPPSSREAPHTLVPSLEIEGLLVVKPAARWMGVTAVHTDGSKRDSSLSFAWVCPSMRLDRQYKVPGPPSPCRTILHAERVAIHAAGSTEELSGVHAIITNSLGAMRLVAAHIACPEEVS